MIKIAILTNVIPSYREGFYDRIFADKTIQVTLFCQENVPGFNYHTIHHKYPHNVKIVKFIAASKEKIVWQCLPFRTILFNYDIVFVDGNPRIVSHALIATLLQLFKKKVVVWSMVHSCWNKSLTENIRIAWLRLFQNHFVYNDHDVVLLEKKGFENKTIIGMNNGLNQRSIDNIISEWSMLKLLTWQDQNLNNHTEVIISSGRLFKGKYEIVIDALRILVKDFPSLLWICVGDGEAKKDIEALVLYHGLSKNVLFTGSIYDNTLLAPYFLSAKMFIHPTAVGLSIMHAFGFGLPIITHDKFDEHGPEIIAFENQSNGLAYEFGNVDSFVAQIRLLLTDDILCQRLSANAKKIVQEKYNTDIMYERFITLAKKIL